jgi:hypothetical protein
MSASQVVEQYDNSIYFKNEFTNRQHFRIVVEQYASTLDLLTLELFFTKEPLFGQKNSDFDFEGIKVCNQNPYDARARFLFYKNVNVLIVSVLSAEEIRELLQDMIDRALRDPNLTSKQRETLGAMSSNVERGEGNNTDGENQHCCTSSSQPWSLA